MSDPIFHRLCQLQVAVLDQVTDRVWQLVLSPKPELTEPRGNGASTDSYRVYDFVDAAGPCRNSRRRALIDSVVPSRETNVPSPPHLSIRVPVSRT
jgi:hypothetical protein